ncbi:hypothetical protein C8Q75DRAFT_835324 [Abortiporus biennis]|nr:hypothetical protein C8Q75DRAFT_835324 [Abortiporus biennis]
MARTVSLCIEGASRNAITIVNAPPLYDEEDHNQEIRNATYQTDVLCTPEKTFRIEITKLGEDYPAYAKVLLDGILFDHFYLEDTVTTSCGYQDKLSGFVIPYKWLDREKFGFNFTSEIPQTSDRSLEGTIVVQLFTYVPDYDDEPSIPQIKQGLMKHPTHSRMSKNKLTHYAHMGPPGISASDCPQLKRVKQEWIPVHPYATVRFEYKSSLSRRGPLTRSATSDSTLFASSHSPIPFTRNMLAISGSSYRITTGHHKTSEPLVGSYSFSAPTLRAAITGIKVGPPPKSFKKTVREVPDSGRVFSGIKRERSSVAQSDRRQGQSDLKRRKLEYEQQSKPEDKMKGVSKSVLRKMLEEEQKVQSDAKIKCDLLKQLLEEDVIDLTSSGDEK